MTEARTPEEEGATDGGGAKPSGGRTEASGERKVEDAEKGAEEVSGARTAASKRREAPAAPPAERPADGGMPRDQRAFVIAMCAVIGAAFAYAACEWGQWTKLAYVPLRGELTFHPPPGIAMLYLGITLWGFGGLVCGALVGAILCRAVPRPWPAAALQLFGAWAISAILLAGGYFTWGLWPW